MLFFSILLHNIPEGMAIGVAFGSVIYGLDGATIGAAMTLAIGIGIQNFPEGSAISLPLRQDGLSRFKSFLFGSLSGLIEIISGIIGYLLVLKITLLLPYLLSFAAGAMIYVVIQELIPDSQNTNKKEFMTLLTMFGFIIMMILDLALG
jgi:ZIP family zinc transporter